MTKNIDLRGVSQPIKSCQLRKLTGDEKIWTHDHPETSGSSVRLTIDLNKMNFLICEI